MDRPLQRKIIHILIDNRRLTVLFAVLVTAILAVFIPGMKTDPTLKSGIDTESAEYKTYERFLESFGGEEFLLVVVKGTGRVDDPDTLKRIEAVTDELEKTDKIVQVISLSNLKVFQEREGVFASYPLMERRDGDSNVVTSVQFASLRAAVPSFDLLVSSNLQTWAVLVRIDDQWKFDVPVIQEILHRISSTVARHLPPDSQTRIVGAPVIRVAIEKYNVSTATTFGVLCLLIAAGVSFYIFKSLRVSIIAMIVMIVCVSWILAFMSLTGIPLTSTTGLSFGLVLIVSVATVIRIVTHFNERFTHSPDRVQAAREALEIVFTPCFMCAVTTAVGFASLMITTIPMVFQLGLIMSLGILISFLLCVILTPAFLILLSPPSPKTYSSMSGDLVARILSGLEHIIFAHPRVCVIACAVLGVVTAAGIPSIQSDTQILRMLSDRTPEMKDIHFVEDNLAPIHSLELFFEADRNTFRIPETWKKMLELDRRLQEVPEVVATDSVLSLMGYLGKVLKGPDTSLDELVSDSRLISDLIAVTSVSSDGRSMLRRYVDSGYGTAHVSVRILNSPNIPITHTIDEIRDIAASTMGDMSTVSVTGDLAVFASQAKALVRSQLNSLMIAFCLITLLLIIHLQSWALGLLSLVPNMLPVTAILGAMGWFGISLDTVTVFCAAISLGLAVDDTVHFLKQLRYELADRGDQVPFETCVHTAFSITAKAMVSTSAVLFFGFIMLLISPFSPVNSFGILSSIAIVTALLGDVVLLPALLLSLRSLRTLVLKQTVARIRIKRGND